MQKVVNYIRNVRTRTEDEKKRVVFLWTAVLMVVIFFIWVISFSLSVVNNNAEEARLQAEAKRLAAEKMAVAQSEATSTPFKGLIPTISDFVQEGAGTVVDGFWAIGNMMHK